MLHSLYLKKIFLCFYQYFCNQLMLKTVAVGLVLISLYVVLSDHILLVVFLRSLSSGISLVALLCIRYSVLLAPFLFVYKMASMLVCMHYSK